MLMVADPATANDFGSLGALLEQGVIRQPVTVTPQTSLQAAIAAMHQANVDYVLITHLQRPIGIFTQADLVRLVASGQLNPQQTIATVMTGSLTLLRSDDIQSPKDLIDFIEQVQVSHLPVVDGSGQVIGILAQQSLQISETFRHIPMPSQARGACPPWGWMPDAGEWCTLFESLQLAVIALDVNGEISYANPCSLGLLGCSLSEIVGQSWFERFIPTAEQAQLTEYFRALLNEPSAPKQFQNTLTLPTGETRFFCWHNTLLYDDNGQVVGTLSLGEDITERQGFARLQEDFISVVSHELRTPLTAIYGGLQLLTQGGVKSDSHRGQQLLEIATKNAQRLMRLTNDILEIEYLSTLSKPLQYQPLNSSQLTHEAVEICTLQASQAEIQLIVKDPALPLVGDGQQLVQVLTHLLDNAIKFSPAHASVWLTVEKTSAASAQGSHALLLFTVRDMGYGIPASQQARIFDKFFQLDTSDTRRNRGTGLGLAIAQRIVEQHGGKIWVDSAPNQGSCFRFTIPMTPYKS